MRLSIQYTEQDLLEAHRNSFVRGGGVKNSRLWLGLVGWSAFFVMAGFLWFGLRHDVFGASASENEPVDLVMLLLPNALMAIFFLAIRIGLILMQMRLSRGRLAFAEQAYSTAKVISGIRAVVFVALIAGAVWAAGALPPIEVHVGRREAMVVSFIPWVFVILVLPLILRTLIQIMRQRRWERKMSFHRPKEMELNDQQVVVRDAKNVSSYSWDAFIRFRETENLFVLVTEDATFLIVPRRALVNESQVMEFRGLLQAHIAEGYFLTVPQGAFPVAAVRLPPPSLGN